jgi:hypothetical protein
MMTSKWVSKNPRSTDINIDHLCVYSTYTPAIPRLVLLCKHMLVDTLFIRSNDQYSHGKIDRTYH